MDLFAAINPLLVVSGFVVGMLVGLTGVGGGSLMTPILVLLFGVHATTLSGPTSAVYHMSSERNISALARAAAPTAGRDGHYYPGGELTEGKRNPALRSQDREVRVWV